MTFKFSKAEMAIILGIASFPIVLGTIRALLSNEVAPDWTVIFCGVLFSIVTTSVLYLGGSFIFQWLNIYYPWTHGVGKRLWREIVFSLLFVIVAQTLIITVFFYTGMMDTPILNTKVYFENIIFGTAISLIVFSIFEGVGLFRRWKESLVRAEVLEKENLKSQFANLRAQLDPHFMFNSINVLSALIRKDPEKAERFLEDFARVYRYVLEVKDEMVVPLKRELQFIEAYLALQQIRFEEGLSFEKNINSVHLLQYLPPLSLQEVVNNAIKHNEVSLEKPLRIRMYSKGDQVIVVNNLQARNESISSTGLGLVNLKERYKLISTEQPIFTMENGDYIAHMPLIKEEG